MTTDSISNSDSYDEPTDSPNRVTTNEARDRLEETLFSALQAGENTLIDAPTSVGKTYQIATTRWRDYPEITGGEPVIHIHQTKKAREDAVEKSREEPGVEYRVLRGRTDACPVAAGNCDGELTAPNGRTPSKWFDWMCNVRNITFQKAHHQLARHCDLPCGEDCDAVTQWWGLSDSDDEPGYDVLHTTSNFAHVDDLIEGANVVFDERPEFGFSFKSDEREQFQQATTNLLDHRSDVTRAMIDLKNAAVRDHPELKGELREHFEDEVSKEWLFRREETHRLAPAIGRAILSSQEVCAERYHGRDGRIEVVLEGVSGEIRHIQHTPDLSQARCVIGLDAFPSETRWEINTVDNLSRAAVLPLADRNWWRRNERGLEIKQLGEATRSYTQGWGEGAGETRGEAVIQKIRQLHGEAFRSCISPSSVEQDVRQMMADAGIEKPKTMHYGEQKSRNDFSNEEIGLLVGCIDPGDENILDLLALREMDAKPRRMITESGQRKRATGRDFVGPDAEVAREILASVRENNLAQAAGRYARNPDDPDSGATVYVWSDALPRMLVDEEIRTKYRSATGKQAGFVQVLENSSGCTAKRIATETDSNKSYVINWLNKMEGQNNVTKSVGTGHQGATEWEWCGGDFERCVMFNP